MKHERYSNQHDLLDTPIPELPSIAGWKEVPLQPSSEQMTPLGIFSDNIDIFTSAVYAAEYNDSPYDEQNSLDTSLLTMFVRESVALKLRHAQQLLPHGYHIVVYDSYRPLEVQRALYNQYYRALVAMHPEWDDEMLSVETQKYVSIPSDNPSRPSPHNTGGSVDVAIFMLPDNVQAEVDVIEERMDTLKSHIPTTITPRDEAENPILREYYLLSMKRAGLVKSHAQVLDFGTDFDNGTETSALRYYEELAKERPLTPEEENAARNRRMLCGVMTESGMVPYADEWWHYNAPESQMGARVLGLPLATFGGIELTAEQLAFEQMRKAHHEGFKLIADKLKKGLRIRTLDSITNDLLELNERAAIGGMADPQMTKMPKAARISPEKAA